MVKLTQSLQQWLFQNHPDLIALITFGHTELFTPDMQREYLAWCRTDEGKKYLKGGSEYKPDPEIETALEGSGETAGETGEGPKRCFPYDDDNCAKCRYDGMFACASTRVTERRMERDVNERSGRDIMFPFRNRARCPKCKKTACDGANIEYIGSFTREPFYDAMPGDFTKMHGYRCRDCSKFFELYEE